MILLLARLVSAAELEPSFAADPFRPALDSELGLAVDTGALPAGFDGRVAWVFAERPLVAYDAAGDWQSVVEAAATLHASAAGRLGWFGLGLDVPLCGVWIHGQNVTWTAGDPMLGVSLSPWSNAELRAAIDMNITFSLGGSEVWSGYPGQTGELLLVLDASPGDWFVAANVGFRDQPEAALGTRSDSVTLTDSLVGRALLGRDIGERSSVAVEALASKGGGAQGTPLELIGSFTRRDTQGHALRAGVGVGVLPGVGAPLFRLVAGVGQDGVGAVDEGR